MHSPTFHARFGWWLVAGVAGLVVLLISIGATQLVSGQSDEPLSLPERPATAAETTTSAPSAVAAQPDELGPMINLRTGRSRPLPRNLRPIVPLGQLRVSPDGRMVAFANGTQIYLATVNGWHVGRLREQREEGTAPSWSPDGSQIVFSRNNAIVVADVDSSAAPRVIQRHSEIWYPNFSADGRTILYTSRYQERIALWTVSASGGPSTLLMKGAFGAYSPDGTTIAYRKTSYDGVDVTQMTAGAVWLADADGSHSHQLSPVVAWMSQVDPEALWPTWSPDGTRIAYQTLYGHPVYVTDVETGRVTVATQSGDPSWLNNNTLIIGNNQ